MAAWAGSDVDFSIGLKYSQIQPLDWKVHPDPGKQDDPFPRPQKGPPKFIIRMLRFRYSIPLTFLGFFLYLSPDKLVKRRHGITHIHSRLIALQTNVWRGEEWEHELDILLCVQGGPSRLGPGLG